MLRGEAQFTADLPVPAGTLHLSFVRSQVAHGRNLTLDTTAALAAPGVAAVFGHDDLGAPPVEFYTETSMGGLMARPLLADGTVRFVGEPVAVVAAESPTAALDAAEFVVVDIEPLQAVTDPEAAAADDAPLLFPDAGTNVVKPLRADAAVIEVAGATGAGGPGAAGLPDGARADPCEGAAFVAELVCENPRVASAP
ncbi:MAG TPA: hypothetical protein DEP69_06950, partial [Acidimicrobiaceae bacterium]|nr:hypothetical protein [Acidimicrobiaceae bacterium]